MKFITVYGIDSILSINIGNISNILITEPMIKPISMLELDGYNRFNLFVIMRDKEKINISYLLRIFDMPTLTRLLKLIIDFSTNEKFSQLILKPNLAEELI